jgi:hypothetical protein
MLRRRVADLELALLNSEQDGGTVPEVLRVERQIVLLVGCRQRRPQRADRPDLKTFAKRVGRLRLPHQHRRQRETSDACAKRHSKITSSDTICGHFDASIYPSDCAECAGTNPISTRSCISIRG